MAPYFISDEVKFKSLSPQIQMVHLFKAFFDAIQMASASK